MNTAGMDTSDTPLGGNLSTERRQALRAGHPLYARLSGDVVWGLYEELGYSAEACGQAMDAFIDQMHEVLAVMDTLETTQAPGLSLVLGVPACEQAGHLGGMVISGGDPAWRELLPPFAVGCRMGCAIVRRPVPDGEAGATSGPDGKTGPASGPDGEDGQTSGPDGEGGRTSGPDGEAGPPAAPRPRPACSLLCPLLG